MTALVAELRRNAVPMKCETNMLQDPTEWHRFMRFAHQHNVKSYLEIGSKHGGTFWRMTNQLPPGSRAVAVDLPQGDKSFKHSEPNLRECVKELQRRKYDVHLFIGDSTDPKIVESVRELSPFDLCFIDANHTEPYILKDWKNYGPMARIIAFHDINHYYPVPDHKMQIHVSKVWNDIKKNYVHEEIKVCKDTNGIGILWIDQPTA